MISDTREHLLGYLLGALEPEEHESVERELENDARLKDELERLSAQLKLLTHDRGHDEPPDGLALRTCVWLATQVQERDADDAQDNAAQNEKVSLPVARMSSAPDALRVARWSVPDFVVTAGILLAAAILFFPAISSGRIRAQLLICQNNLRQLGLALTTYSENNSGLFPQVPPSGNRGVAGIYGPTLNDDLYVVDKNLFVCPSSEIGRAPQTWRGVPSLPTIDAASPPDLLELHRTMGGSFGYGFGYMSNGQYVPARNLHRPYFPIMSDAPNARMPGRASLNHDGRGQNVLLEDGHIQFLLKAVTDALHDDLFLNRKGLPEAGHGPNDAVIGASGMRPLPSGLLTVPSAHLR